MCINFPYGDLNLIPYSSHPTNNYTYGMTIAPKVYEINKPIT